MTDSPNWEIYIQEVSTLIEARETYQRKLGKISSEIQSKFGSGALIGFADEIAESTGRKVSPKTLRNYAWVHDKLGNLELPEDITYRAMQSLSSMENPKEWLDKMLSNGWSSSELIFHIRASRGLNNGKKETLCPNCGQSFIIK